MKIFNTWSLLRSFGYALRGVFYALTRERNLRIHIAAGGVVLYFTRYYHLSRVETGLLALCIGFVIVCEMLNTAIEKTIDLKTPSYHYLAGIAKDVAAGAVLVAAATSVVVGFLLLWDLPTIKIIAGDIAAAPLPWIAAVLVGLLWVFLPQKKS